MKHHFSYLFVFFIILSYGYMVEAKKPLEASFISIPSSITKVEFELYTNNKFVLVIDIFGDEIRALKFKGTWYKENNYYTLAFKKRRGPSLEALFPDYSRRTGNIEIIDTETFRFKENTIELLIYGVKCIRGNIATG